MLPLLCLLFQAATFAPAATPDSLAQLPSRPRFALVLSGGLARGLAEIGVLRALEEEGIRPDLIVGSSMGSLVGALWAAGHSSHAIQRQFEDSDVQLMFEAQPRGLGWRGSFQAHPWLVLFGSESVLGPPAGLLDDSFLNDLLARSLLDADGVAQGDFDRLRIPWRAVATDVANLSPLVLQKGSVAQAVRASSSVPIVFPGVTAGGPLLADGGVSNNLPISLAHQLGAEHVLTVDVALVPPSMKDGTGALTVMMHILQQFSRNGRLDAREGEDEVIWLEMRGISPADFRLVDTLVAIGYRESRATVARIAREWGLPRASASLGERPALAPLTHVAFRTRKSERARFTAAARRLFGPLPAGPLVPDTLASRLARIYRGDLFASAWPEFRSRDGSTVLTFEVREHRRVQVAASGGFERDRGGRAGLYLAMRPFAWAPPPVVRVSGTLKQFGRTVDASIEPHSLARGASGFFARFAARRTDTRIFGPDGDWTLRGTRRVEALAGVQAKPPLLNLVQIGAGAGRYWSGGRMREGALVAAGFSAPGRFAKSFDALAYGGEHPYGRARLTASMDFPTPRVTFRPSAGIAWSSAGTPLDELPGVGGPASLSGLLHDEWLGRRAFAFEMRVVRRLFSGVDASAYAQTAQVEKAVSRTDFGNRPHFGSGFGLRAAIPFGPLAMDMGFGERGRMRFEVAMGEDF